MVQVKVIKTAGESALVQWLNNNTLERAYVPTTAVMGGECPQSSLDAGIPFGVDWESVLPDISFTAKDLADELKKRGIWTHEQLASSPKIVAGAIGTLTGVSYSNLVTASRQEGKV